MKIRLDDEEYMNLYMERNDALFEINEKNKEISYLEGKIEKAKVKEKTSSKNRLITALVTLGIGVAIGVGIKSAVSGYSTKNDTLAHIVSTIDNKDNNTSRDEYLETIKNKGNKGIVELDYEFNKCVRDENLQGTIDTYLDMFEMVMKAILADSIGVDVKEIINFNIGGAYYTTDYSPRGYHNNIYYIKYTIDGESHCYYVDVNNYKLFKLLEEYREIYKKSKGIDDAVRAYNNLKSIMTYNIKLDVKRPEQVGLILTNPFLGTKDNHYDGFFGMSNNKTLKKVLRDNN